MGVSGVSSGGTNFDAVYESASSKNVKVEDFLNLMIAQLKNQDFMNPMDDTAYVTQLAQFSSMQQMQDLAYFSKSNYTMSLVGKEVTAAKLNYGGKLDKVTGVVEKISYVNKEFMVYVNGNAYSLDQIMEINQPKAPSTTTGLDTTKKDIFAADITNSSIKLEWKSPYENVEKDSKITYTVYYSTEDNMDKVAAVKSATMFGEADRSSLSSENIIGLLPDTKYYVNVIVKDANGNESIYKKTEVTTKS